MSNLASVDFAGRAEDNPYQPPVAPLRPVARGRSRSRLLRWAFLGSVLGGGLGLAADLAALFLLLSPAKPGEDDSIGPMVVAMLPFMAAAVIAGGAVLGFLFGLLVGSIASVTAPPRSRPVRTGRLK